MISLTTFNQLTLAPPPMTFKAKIPDFPRYQDNEQTLKLEFHMQVLHKSIWF